MIGKVLYDQAILLENVYNMDETEVMLSMLDSVKILVGKDDLRSYGVAHTDVIKHCHVHMLRLESKYHTAVLLVQHVMWCGVCRYVGQQSMLPESLRHPTTDQGQTTADHSRHGPRAISPPSYHRWSEIWSRIFVH